MERLWAPWRMEYIGQAREGEDQGCLFCEKPKEGDDEKALIVARSEMSFAMLNRYPYNSGHLMVAPADPYIEAFAKAGSDIITVHVEAGPHLDRSLQLIRGLGKKAGVSMNPATPPAAIEYVLDQVDLVLVMTVNPGFGGQTLIPAMVDKVRKLRALIGERPIELEVDGGIGPDNVGALAAAGADVIVAGSAIFASGDYARAIAELRRQALAGL